MCLVGELDVLCLHSHQSFGGWGAVMSLTLWKVLEGMSRLASLREAMCALGNSSLEECWKWSIFHVDQACCKGSMRD